jgi:SAM-dependent methyltransferase
MKLWRRWQEARASRAFNIQVHEGHLGGYIRSDSKPSPNGLDVRNGDPATWSPSLWRWAHETLAIRSVLDVGCGEGHSTRFFENLGCEVEGVDGSPQAKRDSKILHAHTLHDFTQGPYAPDRSFDLVWSCEFVEHVEAHHSDNFLRTFQASRAYILMTHAPPGAGGWHHVNCRNEAYWVALLRMHGFRFDPELTEISRNIAEPGHYRSNGLAFARI